MMSVAVLGNTDATDEMVGHLRHRHSLRQVETAGVDIEMARRPAIAAVHLQQLAIPDEVLNRHRLNVERLRLAPAACPVPIALKLDQLGQPSDQSGEFFSLAISQSFVRESDGIRRLSVHMGQRQAIGIDDPIPTGDWLKSPWRGKRRSRSPVLGVSSRFDGEGWPSAIGIVCPVGQ
jgi:hypothetical protein